VQEIEEVEKILEALPVPVVVTRNEGAREILYANSHAAEIYGITLDSLVGSPAPQLVVDPRERERLLEILHQGGKLRQQEVRLMRNNSEPFWALLSTEAMTYAGQSALCSVFIDITHTKRAHIAIQEALAFAESIISTVRTPLIVLGDNMHVVRVNSAFCDFFDIRLEDTLGHSLFSLSDGVWDKHELRELLRSIAPHHIEVHDFEFRCNSKDLGMRTMMLSARKMYRPGSDTQTILMSLEDITERKRSHQVLIGAREKAERIAQERARELAETERQLATMLNNLPGFAYRCESGPGRSMWSISRGCISLTGYEPAELVETGSTAYTQIIHPEDRANIREEINAAIAENRPFRFEYRIRTKDGQPKFVWEQGVAIRAVDGEIVALEGIVTDATERRHAEEQRLQMERQMRAAQRMEAVGRLAGGVAHDFNNLLTVVQSYARFIHDAAADNETMREDAQMVLEASAQAERLTAQLLAFSRRQVQELKIVELNKMVANLDRMFRRLIGEDIEFVTKLSPELGCVKVDVSQIEQVLLNLVVNARDAMAQGGKLIIETDNVDLDENYANFKHMQVPTGSYVMLSVTDNGPGMSEEVQSRIFEPFFSTKERGKGTGLGLSTVYGIVRQSHGYIWVYSELGHGTVFKVYLPRIDQQPNHHPLNDKAQDKLNGDETILLVEDNVMVRQAAGRILRKHGYEVLEAAHGGEALSLAEQYEKPIQLMVTDVIMPRMSGKELADKATRVHPEMQVIFMSGYTDDSIVQHGVLEENTVFLQKPFIAEALLNKVRDTLDRAHVGTTNA